MIRLAMLMGREGTRLPLPVLEQAGDDSERKNSQAEQHVWGARVGDRQRSDSRDDQSNEGAHHKRSGLVEAATT